MKARTMVPFLALAVGFTAGVQAQTTSSTVATTLQASLNAMVGQQSLQDATLSGQSEYIAGADDESVPFTYQVTSAGSSRMQLPLAAGTLTETRLAAVGGPTGQWQKGDGPIQAMMQHNLMTGECWAFPAFIVNMLLTASGETVTFVAQEGSLLHITAYEQLPGLSSAAAALQQSVSGIDLWVDGSTFLPSKVAFNIHPDSSAGINIPVLVEYSQYQMLNGVLMPTEVRKLVNSTPNLNLQVQSAVFNSGLPPSTFTLQ